MAALHDICDVRWRSGLCSKTSPSATLVLTHENLPWEEPALALRRGCFLVAALLPIIAPAQGLDSSTSSAAKPVTDPWSCTIPVGQRPQEDGCYLLAAQNLSKLPPGPLFWHLYTYPTEKTASLTKDNSTSTVVDAFGKTWLFRIAPASWKPSSGERVAIVGPLKVLPAKGYIARYMQFRGISPEPHTHIHRHSGPEAWYIVSGAQCLQTPEKTFILREGETGIVPVGVPMMLSPKPNESRHSLVLVLHDSAAPWMTRAEDWKPEDACSGW